MKKMYKNLVMLCCLAVFTLSANGVFAQVSVNDSCAMATVLVLDVQVADSITNETTASLGGNPDLWYSFTSLTDVLVDVEGLGTVDVEFTVYYGACGGPEIATVAGFNVDGFCAEANVTYLIGLSSFDGNPGVGEADAFSFEVRTSLADATYCSDPAALNFNPAPSACLVEDNTTCQLNDACSGATVVICGDVVNDTNIGSTVGTELLAPACGPVIEGPGVWYTFQGDGQEITASLCGSVYDSRMHVFSGTCGSFVCEGGNDDFDCNGDGNTFDDNFVSQVTWISSAGTDYYIHISGFGGGVGDFQLSITCDVPSCTPPLNDKCIDAAPLTDAIPLTGTNVCAQANDVQPTCDPFAVINGVWYEWNSGSNNAANITFDVAAAPAVAAAVAPAIAIYSGSCGVPTELLCDDFTLPLDQALIGLDLNTDYFILVWTTTDADEGEFDLTVTGGISGCTLEGSCNYDPVATIDDGSCDTSCRGCLDINAINYQAPDGLGEPSFDDGSCIIAGCDPAPADGNLTTVTPVAFGFCYGNDDVTVYTFAADVPGEGVAIVINSGTVEVNFDELEVYDGADNTAAQINTAPYGNAGDFTGFTFVATGDTLSFAVLSDDSNSCGSGGETSLDISVYCASQIITDCTDVNAINFNPLANVSDNTLCVLNYCNDVIACNYFDASANGGDSQDPSVIETGCCFENCTTISMTDGFGDGGTTVTLFDDESNVIGSFTADALTNEFTDMCMPDGCASLVISTDFAPGEVGITVTTTNEGVLFDAPVGSLTGPETVRIDFGNTGDCIFDGCMDPTALNFFPEATLDCLLVEAGGDFSCCIYERAENECTGAIALVAGAPVDWNTTTDVVTQLGSTNSGNNCGASDSADSWYSYTPACILDATFTQTAFFTSGTTSELAVWEGDCASLTNVECVTSDDFENAEVTLTLTGGVTYYIQVSGTGGSDQGTLDVAEGLCQGCTYLNADNYDIGAGVDDGTCEFPYNTCAGDFNEDGFITVGDLTGFLGVFGTTCP